MQAIEAPPVQTIEAPRQSIASMASLGQAEEVRKARVTSAPL